MPNRLLHPCLPGISRNLFTLEEEGAPGDFLAASFVVDIAMHSFHLLTYMEHYDADCYMCQRCCVGFISYNYELGSFTRRASLHWKLVIVHRNVSKMLCLFH